MKEKVESEIYRITDKILSEAIKDEEGIRWMTIESVKDGVFKYGVNESIFSGNAGICLYFISLFKYSNNQEYLNIAINSAKYLDSLVFRNQDKYYTFLTGYTGVVYVYTTLYEVTHDIIYLQKALKIVGELETGIRETTLPSDFMSGYAGNLFVLINLHSYTADTTVLSLIKTCVEMIISNAIAAPQGVKWDYEEYFIDSLCGLSHGASGIGYALLVAGRYLNSKELMWLGDQAFRYESYQFRKKFQNWPDLRCTIVLKNSNNLYREYPQEFFEQGSDVCTWAHGAAGIGMTRIAAYKITDNTDYLSEATIAFNKCRKVYSSLLEFEDCTLTTGIAGFIDFYCEYSSLFKESKAEIYTMSSASDCIRILDGNSHFEPNLHVSNLSLFGGITGVAYSLIRSLAPAKVPSIGMPFPENIFNISNVKSRSELNFVSRRNLLENIYGSLFIRTIKCMETVEKGFDSNDFWERLFFNSNDLSIHGFIKFVKSEIQSIAQKHNKLIIRDIFTLEHTRIKASYACKSNVFQLLKSDYFFRNFKNHISVNPDLKLKLSSNVRFVKCRWKWNEDYDNNLKVEGQLFSYLVTGNCYHSQEYLLSEFTSVICIKLNSPSTISEITDEVKTQLNLAEISDSELELMVFSQVTSLGEAGLLEFK